MTEVPSQNPNSTFVTVLAWIFIVLSGFASSIGVLQNIMIQSMLPKSGIPASQLPPDPNIPFFAQFMMNHMQLVFVGFLIASLGTLLTSIALLRRLNWARVIFIGIMGLGILWNLVGLLLMANVLSHLPSAGGPPPFPDMTMFRNAVVAFNVVFAVGISGLFAWIIKRLASSAVRAEFT